MINQCLSCIRRFPGVTNPCRAVQTREVIECSGRCTGNPYPCVNCNRKVVVNAEYWECPVKMPIRYMLVKDVLQRLKYCDPDLPVVLATDENTCSIIDFIGIGYYEPSGENFGVIKREETDSAVEAAVFYIR